MSAMCIHMRVSVKEQKRARNDGRRRRGERLYFLGSKTWWSADSHKDRYIYIAMVEEFSKIGGRVGAHLNSVAPGKSSVFKVGKCSSCR